MIIFDDQGVCYKVNDSVRMLESLDNDSLIRILKTTYFAKFFNESLRSLVEKEIITTNNPIIDFDELDESVTFLKNAVTERLTSETTDNALSEVDVYMDEQIQQAKDEKEKE